MTLNKKHVDFNICVYVSFLKYLLYDTYYKGESPMHLLDQV